MLRSFLFAERHVVDFPHVEERLGALHVTNLVGIGTGSNTDEQLRLRTLAVVVELATAAIWSHVLARMYPAKGTQIDA